MSDYRVNIKVRNARLLRAIEQSGHRPGQKFADEVGIGYGHHLLPYLNLTRTPFDENGDLRPCAEKLCVFLKRMPNELWSEEQCYPLASNSSEVELSAADVMALLGSAYAGNGDPLMLLEQNEAKAAFDKMLEMLSARDVEYLRLRFGIDAEAHTLDQVAKKMGVTRERARQIEDKALRRLRHPTREAKHVAQAYGMRGELDHA